MSKALKDIGVLTAIIIASALVYWDSLKLKAGVYDPLGSGTLPRMVAVAIIALSLVGMVQALMRARAARPALGLAAEEEDFERRPLLALAIFGYLIACVVLLHLRVPFGISSSLFVFISSLSIKRFERRAILPSAILALLFGFGLTYLFGTLFGVDLP